MILDPFTQGYLVHLAVEDICKRLEWHQVAIDYFYLIMYVKSGKPYINKSPTMLVDA